MRTGPPKRALQFLRWFCREDYLEEIEGDLIEVFEKQYPNSPRQANWNFFWQVLRHFRPDFIRSFTNYPIMDADMYAHYLKVAWRSLIRQGRYTLINLSGLTTSMTCFLLIALFIQYELNYDRQHEKADRIYRVAQKQQGNTFRGTDLFAVTPAPLAPALRENFPEVESAVTCTLEEHLFSKEGEFFSPRLLFADPNLFDVFTIKMLQGNGAKALKDPDGILLSRSLAEKYFGTEEPMGKTILMDNQRPLIVRGIFQDMPRNQHFTAEGILSIRNIDYYEDDFGKWASNNYYTYLALKSGSDYHHLEQRMHLFDNEIAAAYSGLPFKAAFFLQPLTDIHLFSRVNVEAGINGDNRYVYLLGAIGLIILLLAAINYMNLATARSARRIKEIGIRKVMGALRSQLIGQLLGESIILTCLSFMLALLLAYSLLPNFNRLLNQAIPFDLVGNPWILVSLALTAILIGGLSGLYPAMIVSALSPLKAFKGKLMGNLRQGISLRNVLIVSQFTAAVVLAVGSVVVYQQLQYIRNKKLGFNKEHIVYVPFSSDEIAHNIPTIRNELLSDPKIRKVSVSTNLILNTGNQGIVDAWDGNQKERNLYCYRYFVDESFLDLFEIPLVAGRGLSTAFSTDSTGSVLLNESAVRAIGWTPEAAIGKSFNGSHVVGVVQDFHFQPMDQRIEPMCIRFRHPNNQWMRNGYLSVKLEADGQDKTLNHILAVLKKVAPKTPFQYQFLDQSYAQQYDAESRLGRAFNLFTFLALFIACMGLFGLVSYQIVQRTRELGIRKVLGAPALKLVTLLSRDFVKLVVIALVLAVPIAWFAMQQWLDHFAYRIEIRWWVFFLVAVPALGVSFFTVGLQSWLAAIANPVESLKED